VQSDRNKERKAEMLLVELGTQIRDALNDDDIVEIMRNPDGHLWTEGHKSGMIDLGPFCKDKAMSIINIVADASETVVTREKPVISAEMPHRGERFEGLIPPVVAEPTFTIRKKAVKIFDLESYVENSIMTDFQASKIISAVAKRKNIVIVGGTGSGKTTFANAVIKKISQLTPDHRIIIIEDTQEIQCAQNNKIIMRTSEDVTMNMLLRSSMRSRPDRIIVGEVRGGEALTLIKSWNTGHPGGLATVHANSATAALTRLEQLMAEATSAKMQTLIGEAVDIVVFMKRTNEGRKISEMIEVTGFEDGNYIITEINEKLSNEDYNVKTIHKKAG